MKNILIIGATSGIAIACARLWASEPCRLFLIGRDPSKLEQVGSDLSSRGAVVTGHYALDLVDMEQHSAAIAAAEHAIGVPDLVLVAHGTLPDQQACEADAARSVREFTANGLSVISILTLLANPMVARGHGCIVVISSVAGDRGRPSNYLYGSAKAAVSAFCEGLQARLFKSGVHLLLVKPGFVATPMTAGLDLPPALTNSPERVARDIQRAIEKKTDVLYTAWFWRYIMLIIRHIPTSMFKRQNM